MMRNITIVFLVFFSSCSSTVDKKAEFQKRTSLIIEDSIFNIGGADTYFPHEGEYSIVFKTTEHQIKKWLTNNPPWNNATWSVGQIPHEIGIACQFNFPERVGVGSNQDGKKSYSGNKDLEKLLNDTTNYYAFRKDCCNDDIDAGVNDGALIIIQQSTNMVYYSNWNY
jgi:hypothetical protein